MPAVLVALVATLTTVLALFVLFTEVALACAPSITLGVTLEAVDISILVIPLGHGLFTINAHCLLGLGHLDLDLLLLGGGKIEVPAIHKSILRS